MVLEWCGGGSLASMLEQPENLFGLSEESSVKLLTDLGKWGLSFTEIKANEQLNCCKVEHDSTMQ